MALYKCCIIIIIIIIIIKGRTPLRRWSVTIGHDEKKMCNREENRQLYKDYYRNQAGGVGTMPVFVGRRHQRGHGLTHTGGLFKCFVMQIVAPVAKRIGKQILGNVAKTGIEVAGDVIGRRNIKETLKDRGLAGIKERSPRS